MNRNEETLKTSSVPKFTHVADFICDQIRSGTYKIGEYIPGERVIAELLKVSRPSVRRAIQHLADIELLECHPSKGSLVVRMPDVRLIVGYLVEDLQDPFHMELIQEMDRLLHEVGGVLIVAEGTDDSRMLAMGMNRIIKHNTLHSKSSEEQVPAVYIGNVHADVDMVVSDVESGMQLIHQHLSELGHTRFAYASQFEQDLDPQYGPFQEALDQSGHHLVRTFTVNPRDEVKCAEIVSAMMNPCEDRPTALVCYNDWIAMSVMHAAKMQGISIPGDFSVTGYDDLFMNSVLQMGLTTIRFSRMETARKILEMFQVPKNHIPRKEMVKTDIIIRESTAPPPDL